jgi:small subunit ribosomal protein S15
MTEKKTANPFQRHVNDTWSPEFQIWALTDEISMLQWHLKEHPKDFDAKRSLLKKVAKRRRFLKYIKNNDLENYTKVSKKVWVKV